ncbi:MAG: cytochrome-c peroxidase [Bdellovibrionia bacterium]
MQKQNLLPHLIFSLVFIFTFAAQGQNPKNLLRRAQDAFGIIKHSSTLPDQMSSEQLALGQKLFFDPRLSADLKVSCATCHTPQNYGTAPISQHQGAHGVVNPRNTQSNLNLKFQHVTHWRGDRKDMLDQAVQAFTSPETFAHQSEKAAEAHLRSIGYEKDFQQSFPLEKKPLNIANAARALVMFQESLITPSAFDRFLEGDIKALTASQLRGMQTFMNVGCVSCHNGPAVGGKSLQRFGITQDYWQVTGSKVQDPGRFAVTGNESDRNVFKIPSLRNVTETKPYFHDGSAEDLKTAIRWMGILQLNTQLSSQQTEEIHAFLEALKGENPYLKN